MPHGNRYGRRAPRFPKKKRGHFDPKEEARKSSLRRVMEKNASGKWARPEGEPDLLAAARWEWLEKQGQSFSHERYAESGRSMSERVQDAQRAFEREELERMKTLLEQKKRKELLRSAQMEYFREKRTNKEYVRRLFARPVNFKTSDGKHVRILSFGLENVYPDLPPEHARAMVGVFVEGKRIFFYRSSGRNSKMPGTWFPVTGTGFFERHKPRIEGFTFKGEYSMQGIEVRDADFLRKLHGHPKAPNAPYFPKWVEEVAMHIAQAVAAGKVKLNPVNAPADVKRFQLALDYFPPLETSEGSGSPKLPE